MMRRELEIVREELRQIREVVMPRGASLEDTALVIAIRRHVADAVFSVGDLIEHARLPQASALAAAIVAAVGALNARKLGQRLRRLEGEQCDGIEIVRVSSDRDGAVWGARVLKT